MSIASMTGRWADRKNGLGGGPDQNQQPFEELTGYIPVESITLFVAAVSLLGALSVGKEESGFVSMLASTSLWNLYLVFGLILTPLIVLLVAAGKFRMARKADSTLKFKIPYWPVAAAVVAFLAWALAVPGLVDSTAAKLLAAFAALFVSKFLSLFEGLFG